MTLRDAVWDEILVQLVESGYFKISDLSFSEDKRHTVRRVLKQMEEQDWVERESEKAAIWRIGPKGRRYLNVSAEKIKAAEPNSQ